ncbi:MAG TPA: S24 family peptidase [Thermoanaerobaculia bacterium]|jgi:hypothetical protein
MPQRADPDRRIVALAKAIGARKQAFRETYRGETFKIDDTTSRILENDPDYQPARRRSESKQRGPVKNPGIFTVKDIANRLHTTVGFLLAERGYDVSIDDRRRMRDFVIYLTERFHLLDVELARGRDDEAEYVFEIPEASFRELDHDYPRPLHAFAVSQSDATASAEPLELMITHALHAIREVREGALQVVRVRGDSMAGYLRDGTRILIDTRLRRPRNGDVVAVYIKSEGGVLGYWRAEREQYFLDKHNDEHSSIRLGHQTGWVLWGTATKIVEAPIERRR